MPDTQFKVAEIHRAGRRATNQAGGLKQINRQYKAYRLAQIAKAEQAVPRSSWRSDTPRRSCGTRRQAGGCCDANGKRTLVLRPCCME
jgi:hypothetical protein